MAAFDHRAGEITAHLVAIEATLDAAAATDADAEIVEARNASLVACKDAVWALQCDRLGTARAIEDLAGRGPLDRAALSAYYSIQVTLSALDRLEVRGRDSAGLHVLVTGHGLDLADADVARLIRPAAPTRCSRRGSVRVAEGQLGFVYKTAAEIGELGDNTARSAPRSATTTCCASRCGRRPRRPRCSRTRGGRASASSPRRTRTP